MDGWSAHSLRTASHGYFRGNLLQRSRPASRSRYGAEPAGDGEGTLKAKEFEMAQQFFDANGFCTIQCPWKGAHKSEIERWAQEGYRMDADTWARNYERMSREDAEDTRRTMYPTASERIADDEGL